ncbi:Tyrosine recombinase XerH [termite gut metagenome]|uniref:Tyrosine recombinase XerH n=1 Tax=termite gut metagenome TaxID=433724 RepID=A0A5J4RSB2_9ZZZZ
MRTGIRCIEASRLRVCDIVRKGDRYILSLRRKGDEARIEKMGYPEEAVGPLIEYLSFCGVSDANEPAFANHVGGRFYPMRAQWISSRVNAWMKKAGVYSLEKTAHSLRHTAAVLAHLNCAGTKDIQMMLGHGSLATTQRYLDSIDDTIKMDNPALKILNSLF